MGRLRIKATKKSQVSVEGDNCLLRHTVEYHTPDKTFSSACRVVAEWLEPIDTFEIWDNQKSQTFKVSDIDKFINNPDFSGFSTSPVCDRYYGPGWVVVNLERNHDFCTSSTWRTLPCKSIEEIVYMTGHRKQTSTLALVWLRRWRSLDYRSKIQSISIHRATMDFCFRDPDELERVLTILELINIGDLDETDYYCLQPM